MRLEDVEREAILAALQFYHGNKTQTAAALDMALRTLDYKLAKYKGEQPATKEKENAQV